MINIKTIAEILPSAALLSSLQPAQANWSGGAAQQSAAAYCASRAAGNTHKKAEKDAKWVLVNSMQGHGFASGMATALTSGRQMMQTTGYMIKQMCPDQAEFFRGGTTTAVDMDEFMKNSAWAH